MSSAERSGMTLLEVVVSGVTTLILLAILLPGCLQIRPEGRRTQCLNNERNVTLAILSYASANQGRLPAQASYLVTPGTDDHVWDVAEGSSWAVTILPHLDQRATYERWNFTQSWNSETIGFEYAISNRELSNLLVEAFSCPNDPSAFQVEGGLSYVVNCGIGDSSWMTVTGSRRVSRLESGQHPRTEQFDWDGDNEFPPNDADDVEINRDLMVFWPELHVPDEFATNVAKPLPHQLGKLFDGSSNTIMLAENVNAGARPGQKVSSWADPQLSSSGFLLPIDATRVSPSIHQTDGSLASLVISTPFNPAINAARTAGEGMAPFPNSNHPGIGVFAFCDGSVRTLSEDIDMQVYSRLITPCGTRLRETENFAAEKPVDGGSF